MLSAVLAARDPRGSLPPLELDSFVRFDSRIARDSASLPKSVPTQSVTAKTSELRLRLSRRSSFSSSFFDSTAAPFFEQRPPMAASASDYGHGQHLIHRAAVFECTQRRTQRLLLPYSGGSRMAKTRTPLGKPEKSPDFFCLEW